MAAFVLVLRSRWHDQGRKGTHGTFARSSCLLKSHFVKNCIKIRSSCRRELIAIKTRFESGSRCQALLGQKFQPTAQDAVWHLDPLRKQIGPHRPVRHMHRKHDLPTTVGKQMLSKPDVTLLIESDYLPSEIGILSIHGIDPRLFGLR